MDIIPAWWTLDHKNACLKAHRAWKKELYAILVRKPIIHPFRDVTPPETITEEHITLLKAWDSVRASVVDSVRDSVRDSVGDSVWASVGDSVWASVRDSVRDSVWASVVDLVGAYTGTFFNLPRSAWKYTEKIPGNDYPFAPAVKLWEKGLVPSFDGKTWRLHGGPKGKVLWEGTLA